MQVLINAFPLWVLGASALALFEPSLFTWFSGPLIPFGLGVIMLSMGLTIDVGDFRRIGHERARVLPGVALQYTLMPALGWGISAVFNLPTPFAVGLILVSCCPGGTASNVISFLARADVALSVTMTALSTLVAAVMTPLLTELLAGNRVPVPATGLLLDTVQVVLVPVALGLVLQRQFPAASQRVRPIAPLVAVLAITLIAASVIGANRHNVLEAGVRLVGAVVTLHIAGFLSGYLAGRLFLGRELAARTVAIEVGMQNSGLGVVLAQQNFVNPLVALPCALSAVFHSLVGSVAAGLWRLSRAGDTRAQRATTPPR